MEKSTAIDSLADRHQQFYDFASQSRIEAQIKSARL